MWEVHGNAQGNISSGNEVNLVDFNGTGTYSSPEFTWNKTIGVTAIKFLNSSRYGKDYQNDIFVGSANNNGELYHFDLNAKRTGLNLKGLLKDKIADNYDELEGVIFGKNFGIISDLTVGPNGYLYIVSLSRGEIYRLIPTTNYEG